MWFIFLMFCLIGLLIYNFKEGYYKAKDRTKSYKNGKPTYMDSKGNNYLTYNGKKVIYTTDFNGDWVIKDAKTLKTIINFSDHYYPKTNKKEKFDCTGQFKIIEKQDGHPFVFGIDCFNEYVIEEKGFFWLVNGYYTNVKDGCIYVEIKYYLGEDDRWVGFRQHPQFRVAVLYNINNPSVICYAPKGVKNIIGRYYSGIKSAEKCEEAGIYVYEDIDVKAIKLLEDYLNKLLDIHKEMKFLYEDNEMDLLNKKFGFPTHKKVKKVDYIYDGLSVVRPDTDTDEIKGYDDTIINEFKLGFKEKFVKLFDHLYDYKITCSEDRAQTGGSLIVGNESGWLERFDNYYDELKTEIENINVKEIADKIRRS